MLLSSTALNVVRVGQLFHRFAEDPPGAVLVSEVLQGQLAEIVGEAESNQNDPYDYDGI
jgi:hypothetical protein